MGNNNSTSIVTPPTEIIKSNNNIISKDLSLQLHQSYINREQILTRYLSQAYLNCVLKFNQQLITNPNTTIVYCSPLLNTLEKKELQKSLHNAGFNEFDVMDKQDRVPYQLSEKENPTIVIKKGTTIREEHGNSHCGCN